MSQFDNPLVFFLWLVWNHINLYLHGAVYLLKQYAARRVPLSNVPEPYAGTVAVVTGGGSGIGLEIVKKLMAHGVHVVVGVRDPKAVQEKLARWSRDTKALGVADCIHLDLSSLDSVQRFADELEAMQTPVNLLINNAGVLLVPRSYTKDHYETTFQVNHLAHYLLTYLLLPLLKTGAAPELPSRVVNVASCVHRIARGSFRDTQFHEGYSGALAYAQSKLWQVSSSVSWGEEVRGKADFRQHPVTFVSVHPGFCSTGLYRNASWYGRFAKKMMDLLLLSPEDGARFVIHAAFDGGLSAKNGAYLEFGREVKPSELVTQRRFRKAVWMFTRDFLDMDGCQL